MKEGFLEFRGHRVWYGIEVPDVASKPPLLVVNGGPGIPHDYLEPLSRLSSSGRPIVFYDQLGSGRSDRPDDESLWNLGTFADEIDAVRSALDLEIVHILGHSAGGTILLEYALGQPPGVRSLVLASAVPSIAMYLEEGLKQIDVFGPHARELVLSKEHAGETDDPEYRAVFNPWMEEHMLRLPLDKWPEPLLRAFEGMGAAVYQTMWNGGQFTPNGNLLEVDLLSRLGQIQIPTLLVHGEHDYITPEIGEQMQQRIGNSRLAVVRDASHMPWFENPDPWFGVIAGFLDEIDGANDLPEAVA